MQPTKLFFTSFHGLLESRRIEEEQFSHGLEEKVRNNKDLKEDLVLLSEWVIADKKSKQTWHKWQKTC